MTNDDKEFIHIVMNQEPNINDELRESFLRLKGSIAYIATWIDDFHNEEVYVDDTEKRAMIATFTKISHILEDELQ